MASSKIAICLVLNLAFAACVIGLAQAQTEYSIEIGKATWDHSNIMIQVIPQENESWWDPTFVETANKAADIWNEALVTFASMHQDFGYVSKILLHVIELKGAKRNFDVYLTWTEKPPPDSSSQVGLTTQYSNSGVIERCDMTLAVKDSYGLPLSDVLKQSVVTHEMGHALGLFHSNYSEDVMFDRVSLDISVRPISTLDVYGVAQVFRWMSVSSQFNVSHQGSTRGSVSLPVGLEYEYLNAPQQDAFSSTLSSFLRYIQTSEGRIILIGTSIAVVGVVVTSSAAYRFRKRGKEENKRLDR